MSQPIYCSGKRTLPKPLSFVNSGVCSKSAQTLLPLTFPSLSISQPHSIHVPYLLLILGFNLFKAGGGHLHAGLTRKWPQLLLIFLVEPITIHLGSKTRYWKQGRRIYIDMLYRRVEKPLRNAVALSATILEIVYSPTSHSYTYLRLVQMSLHVSSIHHPFGENPRQRFRFSWWPSKET